MLDLSLGRWILAAASSFLVGLSKTGIPGLGVLAAPLFAGVMPARASTGAFLPLLIIGDLFAVAAYRRHAVWSHLLRLIPWALGGIVAGYLIMGRISDDQLRPLLGIAVLAILALGTWRDLKRGAEAAIPTQWWFAALIGLLAGATTMLTNAAGPIMLVYLLAMRLPKNAFLGTSGWYFLILNCVKVPFSISLGLITPQSLVLDLALSGVVIAGAIAGLLAAKRIPEKAFTIIVKILALAVGLNLIIGVV